MNQIKLKPKQESSLKQVVAQKTEVSKLLNELNAKETLLLELIFEQNEVTGVIANVKLNEGYLEYEFAPKEEVKTIEES